MKKYINLSPHVLLVILFTCCLGVSVVSQDLYGACNPMTYAESQDSEFRKWCGYGSVYTKDNNSWVLTEYARKRFAMPEEWQDDGLIGAEIAAFRIEPSGRQRCHGEGDNKKCVPSYECVLELWIKNDVDIGIIGNREQDFKPWKSSIVDLAKKNPELREKWEESFGLKGTELVVDGQVAADSLRVIAYDKTLKKDLTMITMLIDGQMSLLPINVKREVNFLLKDNSYHTIELPSSFWRRVGNHHRENPEISEQNWSGGEEIDNNLWVYTEEFAEKYKMPISGISEDLNGALAVAYYLKPTGQDRCGYFSEKGRCGKGIEDRTIEFYFPIKTVMPYSKYGDLFYDIPGKSWIYLHGQNYRKEFSDDYGIDPFKLNWMSRFFYRTEKSAKKRPHKWFGGGGYFNFFIDHSFWDIGFSIVSLENIVPVYSKGFDENFFVFLNAKSCPGSKEAFEQSMKTVSLPPLFIEGIQEYYQLNKNKAASVIEIVKKKYGN